MIQFPRILKNLNLFVDGRGHAGHVDEVTLPKLTIKTEEHRAGGMDLPVELDMGMEKLEASIVLSDTNPDIFRLLRAAGQFRHPGHHPRRDPGAGFIRGAAGRREPARRMAGNRHRHLETR